MTTSQPPSADGSPGQAFGQAETPTVPGPVRPAALAGAVLALLTYLCGFFGAYDYFFPMILVLAGGLLALIGLLPKVGRVLVPSAVLASSGFFLLLLNATSPGYSSGAAKWVALALALLSAAAIVAALLFEVGVLTAPAPRPARPPQPPAGWSPYGQAPYGAPPPGAGQQPGALFDQGAYGQTYGAPGSYGYGAPGQPVQPGYGGGYPGQPSAPPASAPGGPGYGSSVSGGYGAVGAGGYGSGPGSAYGSPNAGYGQSGQPAPTGHPGQGAGSFAPPPTSVGPDGQPPATSGADQASGSQPANGGGSTPASAPTLAPAGDSTPESTTPGVPASGGGDTLSDAEDERTRSFRPDGPSGSGS